MKKIIFAAVFTTVFILLEMVFARETHTPPGTYAALGLGSALLLIAASKLLGKFLSRKEDNHDH